MTNASVVELAGQDLLVCGKEKLSYMQAFVAIHDLSWKN